VTLTPAGGAVTTLISDTCAGTVDGCCSVTFTSDKAGTITGHASVDISVGGEPLHRETDGTGSNSDDAVKTFVDGTLCWLKVDNQSQLLGGATFEVCRIEDRFGNPVTGECQLVVDNSPPDNDPDDGEFELIGLKLGCYTIEEKAAPQGYQLDSTTQTVCLTLENPANTGSCPEFVNTPPGQACSPGFWRHEQKFPYWCECEPAFNPVANYCFAGPATKFVDAFELTDTSAAPWFDVNTTLLTAVNQSGGTFNQVLFKGTASLLNAAHPEVNNATVEDVRSVMQQAFAGDISFEAAQAYFNGLIALEYVGGCPLD